jgi:hypothetical protein
MAASDRIKMHRIEVQSGTTSGTARGLVFARKELETQPVIESAKEPL